MMPERGSVDTGWIYDLRLRCIEAALHMGQTGSPANLDIRIVHGTRT